MSYEVLAQKWRPQSFHQVVGQKHVITTLQNQIRSNRIGHAYLFWGPRGTGKTTVARLLAKAVNCPNRQRETEFSQEVTAEPCNQCQWCVEITHGRSFDVIEIDAASHRGIDPIRELGENTKLAPASCTYKVYIIDEVHMLTQEAFNAFLKTLEEPPAHVIFILPTTERQKLPKSIISRCQDFDFRYMEADLIVSRLQEICIDEGIQLDEHGLALITRQSEGCLRDAENLLERLISSAGKSLDLETIHQILGLGSATLIDGLIDAILARNLSDALIALANLAKIGADLTQCLHQLITHFRDLRLLAIDPKNLTALIQHSVSEQQRLREKAGKVSADRLSRLIKILMHTSGQIKQNGYAQIHLETALIDICSIQETLQLGDILRKLSDIEDRIDRHSQLPNADLGLQTREPGREGGIRDSGFGVREEKTGFGTRGSELGIRGEEQRAKSKEQRAGEEIPALSPLPSALRSLPEPRTPNPEPRLLIRHPDELPRVWGRVLAALKEEQMVLYHNLKEATPMLEDGNQLKITCRPLSIQWMQDDEKRIVSEVIANVVGGQMEVDFVASSTTPEMNRPTSRNTQQDTLMKLQYDAERDPQLIPALNLFEARILKIEPK